MAASTQNEAVLLQIEDGIATLTLNEPENRNLMTPKILEGLDEKLDIVLKSRDVRVVVLTGKDPSFCAGADFRTLPAYIEKTNLKGVAAFHTGVTEFYKPFFKITELQVPVIAAINGHCIGGGMGLALLCDLRLCADEATFSVNFSRIAVHPGMGSTYTLPRLIGVEKAQELFYTGRRFKGKEAEHLGLVLKSVPRKALEAEVRHLSTTIAAGAPYIVRLTKQAIYDGLQWEVKQHLRREALGQALCAQMGDAAEGIQALLQKREPVFKGE